MNGPRRQRGAMRNVFWLLGLAALAVALVAVVLAVVGIARSRRRDT